MEPEVVRAAEQIMHPVIYVSCCLIGHKPGVLREIVQRSATRNEIAGVTGMLWSDGDHFVQALEGSEEAVSATMQRILADHRHTSIEIAEAREIQSPRFGAWSMIEADQSAVGDECGIFLLGLAGMASTPARRRIREVILSSLG